jgi:NADH-quinone oxidoreductase subunit M
MLYLVQRVFFGPSRQPKRDPKAPPIPDLDRREVAALVPLVVFIVWIGVQPRFFLDRMAPTLDRLTQRANQAVDEQQGLERNVARDD